jgi:hypothetical protein
MAPIYTICTRLPSFDLAGKAALVTSDQRKPWTTPQARHDESAMRLGVIRRRVMKV